MTTNLLYLISAFHFFIATANSIQMISIQPSQFSNHNSSPIVITKQHFPASFLTKQEFTVCFEFKVIMHSSNLPQNVPVMNFGDSKQAGSVRFNPNGSFDLGSVSGLAFIWPLKKAFSGFTEFYLNFALEVQVDDRMSLVYLDFQNSNSTERPFDLTKRVWESTEYSQVDMTLLEILVTGSADWSVQVRNVYAVDKLFQPTDP